MSRISFGPIKTHFKELTYLLTAACAVIFMAQNVYSQQASLPSDDRLEREFAGDRGPGILEEPSDTPTGDQAALYLEVEEDFERAKAEQAR